MPARYRSGVKIAFEGEGQSGRHDSSLPGGGGLEVRGFGV
jgi:hypothetical protein